MLAKEQEPAEEVGSRIKVYNIPRRGGCQCVLYIIDLSEAVKCSFEPPMFGSLHKKT